MSVDMTRRQKIIEMLKEGPISFMAIANNIGMPIKELEEDLDHVSHSCELKTRRASCKKCGFQFSEDKRFKTPSKCPKCRGERIEPQEFWITECD